MRLKRRSPCVIAAALFLGLASPGVAAPIKLRVAYIVPGSNFFSIFAAKKDVAPHFGQSYTIEATRYQATPAMITAMAVGDLDIGLLNSTSLSLGVENAGMTDLRVFADEFRDGVEGYGTNAFMVRNDGPKTAADLKGKTLATNSVGSMVDVAMRLWLRKAGLEDKRDYTVIETGLNTSAAVLLENKVALAPFVPPFSFDPKVIKDAHTLFTQRDALGPSELGVWAARDTFLKTNHAAIVDFLEDAMRVLRWYSDPANHEEAVKIVASVAKAPSALFEDWTFTKKDYYRDPALTPDLAAMQANVDAQRRLGFINGAMDVKKYTDLSYVEEARKRVQ